MKWSLILFVILLVGCAGADSGSWSGPPSAEGVRVATYNIHHWEGRDESVDVARIARVIDGLDVDIVAIQEADNNLMGEGDLRRQDLFSEVLDGDWVEFEEGDQGRVAHGNAVFVRPWVDVVSTGFVDVSEAGRDPRAFTDTVVDVRGRRVRLLGAHFGLNGGERSRQIDTLAAHIGDGGEVDGTVVMGDFNEWNPLARTFRPIRSTLNEITGSSSFPSSGPMLRLDRIFASEHADVDHVEVVRTVDSSVASDHLPVRAELIF